MKYNVKLGFFQKIYSYFFGWRCSVFSCKNRIDSRCLGGNCTKHCNTSYRCDGICIFAGSDFGDDEDDGGGKEDDPEPTPPELEKLGKLITKEIINRSKELND